MLASFSYLGQSAHSTRALPLQRLGVGTVVCGQPDGAWREILEKTGGADTREWKGFVKTVCHRSTVLVVSDGPDEVHN